MDKIKEAFAIEQKDKEIANRIFLEALKKIVNKNHLAMTEDPFVELSAIFGQLWLVECSQSTNDFFDVKMFAHSNTLFNYAHLSMGTNYSDKFIKIAKSLVKSEDRISDESLLSMSKKMKFFLTVTNSSYA